MGYDRSSEASNVSERESVASNVSEEEANAAYERINSSKLITSWEKNALTLMYKEASYDAGQGLKKITTLDEAYKVAEWGMNYPKSIKITSKGGDTIQLQSGSVMAAKTLNQNLMFRRETARTLLRTPIKSTGRFVARMVAKAVTFPIKIFYPEKFNDAQTIRKKFNNAQQGISSSSATQQPQSNQQRPVVPVPKVQDVAHQSHSSNQNDSSKNNRPEFEQTAQANSANKTTLKSGM